jgi:hypothetical protein
MNLPFVPKEKRGIGDPPLVDLILRTPSSLDGRAAASIQSVDDLLIFVWEMQLIHSPSP